MLLKNLVGAEADSADKNRCLDNGGSKQNVADRTVANDLRFFNNGGEKHKSFYISQ